MHTHVHMCSYSSSCTLVYIYSNTHVDTHTSWHKLRYVHTPTTFMRTLLHICTHIDYSLTTTTCTHVLTVILGAMCSPLGFGVGGKK